MQVYVRIHINIYVLVGSFYRFIYAFHHECIYIHMYVCVYTCFPQFSSNENYSSSFPAMWVQSWSHFYRLKHLLSEQYLCVVRDYRDLQDSRRALLGGALQGPFYKIGLTSKQTHPHIYIHTYIHTYIRTCTYIHIHRERKREKGMLEAVVCLFIYKSFFCLLQPQDLSVSPFFSHIYLS